MAPIVVIICLSMSSVVDGTVLESGSMKLEYSTDGQWVSKWMFLIRSRVFCSSRKFQADANAVRPQHVARQDILMV